MLKNETAIPALDLSEAVMQTALEKGTPALNEILCSMKRAALLPLSNQVATSLEPVTEPSIQTPVGSRAALHQVTRRCRPCRRPSIK